MAKNPNIVRTFKVTNKIHFSEAKVARIIHHQLMDQLQLCTATSSLQNIFCLPSSTYKIFCPSAATNIENHPHPDKKRTLEDKDKIENPPKKKKGLGSIINTTGKRLFFPKGLEKNIVLTFSMPMNLVNMETIVILFTPFFHLVFLRRIERFLQNTSMRLKVYLSRR